jgi:hypothetical protein
MQRCFGGRSRRRSSGHDRGRFKWRCGRRSTNQVKERRIVGVRVMIARHWIHVAVPSAGRTWRCVDRARTGPCEGGFRERVGCWRGDWCGRRLRDDLDLLPRPVGRTPRDFRTPPIARGPPRSLRQDAGRWTSPVRRGASTRWRGRAWRVLGSSGRISGVFVCGAGAEDFVNVCGPSNPRGRGGSSDLRGRGDDDRRLIGPCLRDPASPPRGRPRESLKGPHESF